MQQQAFTQVTNLGTSTAETTIVSADPTCRNNLTALLITSLNAAAAVVTIKDSTGGTTRLSFDFPNSTTAPVPLFMQFDLPLRQLAGVNNNWTATVSANATGTKITAFYSKEF